MMTPSVIETYMMERELQRLIFELARCMDQRDIEGLRNLFTEDAVFEKGGSPLVGLDVIMRFIGEIPVTNRMLHIYTNIVIDCVDPDHARSRSNYVAYSRSSTAEDRRAALIPVSIGNALDEFRLTPTGWRIAKRTLVYIANA